LSFDIGLTLTDLEARSPEIATAGVLFGAYLAYRFLKTIPKKHAEIAKDVYHAIDNNLETYIIQAKPKVRMLMNDDKELY
jgi:hypothetical protein